MSTEDVIELKSELAALAAEVRELVVEYRREVGVSELMHRELQDMARRHEATIYGNGRLGLLTRTDRLEQTDLKRLWAQRAMWSAIFTAWAGLLVVIMTRWVQA